MRLPPVAPVLLAALLWPAAGPAQGATRLAREVLAEMVSQRTTTEGSTTPLAESLAARFRAAGFPAEDVLLLGAGTEDRNLVVRLRGRDRTRPPRLFGAHLDVVGAEPPLWSADPWTLTERDGVLYGRGVQDDKGPAASLVAAFLTLQADGVVRAGDLLLMLTAGEESGKNNGVDWLVTNRPDLTRAEFAIIADAGGGEMVAGAPVAFSVQSAEKIYLDVTLTARGPGGHSSVPNGPSPIDRLARAISAVGAFTFPVTLNPVAREFLRARATMTPGAQGAAMAAIARDPSDAAAARTLSADPALNALLRTTCIVSLVSGGTAPNAIPAEATANVNCRVIPGTEPDSVVATLRRLAAPAQVEVTVAYPARPSPPSVLPAVLRTAITESLAATVGPVPIIPFMEMGATDGVYLRNLGIPTFGVIGLFTADAELRTMHGNDERVTAAAYDRSVEFMLQLVRRLAR